MTTVSVCGTARERERDCILYTQVRKVQFTVLVGSLFINLSSSLRQRVSAIRAPLTHFATKSILEKSYFIEVSSRQHVFALH